MTNGQHGLKAGEVCLACRNDQGSVKKLTMQLLHFEQHMGLQALPREEREAVILALGFDEGYCPVLQVPEEASEWELMVKWDVLFSL